jgi:hypothetical protein
VISISGVLPPNGQALLGAGDAPTLWFIGSEDPLITDENRVLANAGVLYNAGVVSVPEVLQGAGHVPVNDEFGPTIFSQSANFLYFMLDLGHAAGSRPN